MNYKCIRCNYECDNLKRINDHLERKNLCKDLNNINISDKSILKAKILDNLIIKEKKTKIKNEKLINQINYEEYNILEKDMKKEKEENNINKVLDLDLEEKNNLINENINIINEDNEYNNSKEGKNTNIFTLKDMINKKNVKFENCTDFSKLFDSQKHEINISQHLKFDIIFNYNINLNIKEVTPFMKNPKMKESIEKLIEVVKTENNKIAKEQINKDYEYVRNQINDINFIDEKKIELMFEKTINMDISYNMVYYYDEVDNKGFFYIYDIIYQKHNI